MNENWWESICLFVIFRIAPGRLALWAFFRFFQILIGTFAVQWNITVPIFAIDSLKIQKYKKKCFFLSSIKINVKTNLKRNVFAQITLFHVLSVFGRQNFTEFSDRSRTQLNPFIGIDKVASWHPFFQQILSTLLCNLFRACCLRTGDSTAAQI